MKTASLIVFVLGFGSLAGCGGLAREATVALPFPNTTARFEVWTDTAMDRRYELVVKNDRGEVRTRMWEDWGPVTRANVYVTPENFVVVIGGHGCCYAVRIREGQTPKLADFAEYRNSDSRKWTYLGAVGFTRAGEYRFFVPAERRECISNFGGGGDERRVEYQVAGECSWTDVAP